MDTPNNSTTLKRCTCCKCLKPLDEFCRHPQKMDGRHPQCRVCRSINRGGNLKRLTPTDLSPGYKYCHSCKKALPATTEYFHSNKAKSDGLNSQCKTCRTNHYYTNRDGIQAKNRIARLGWYQRNKERTKITTRAWRNNNPEKARNSFRRWLTRKHNFPIEFTSADWLRALEYWNNSCAACGRPQGLWHMIAADHWIPLASPDCPGTIPANIIPLCHGEGGCNNGKSDKHALTWLTQRFGTHKANLILKKVEDYFEWVRASMA